MTVHGSIYEVELTGLFSAHLRNERRLMFAVGQSVRDALAAASAADASVASALTAYDVLLRDEAATPMPANKKSITRTTAAIANQVTVALTTSAPVEAPRTHIGTETGIAVFVMPAVGDDPSATPRVHVSTSSTSTALYATRASINEAVAQKDRKSRKYVVIVAGDPSNEGLILPVEIAEFELIDHAGAAPVPPLTHVKEAWLHLAGTHHLVRLV